MLPFTAAIVDDEQDAIDLLKGILRRFFPQIEVIGEALCIGDGVKLLEDKNPKVLFLDVNMPPYSGFDLLRRVDCSEKKIIFCTAFDHYAIQAIKFSAFDYLMKPIQVPILMETLSRLVEEEEEENSKKIQIETLISTTESSHSPERLVFNSQNECHVVQLSDIYYFKADGNYTEAYLSNGAKVFSSKPIAHYTEMLGKTIFLRVHKSYLVNIDAIRTYLKQEGAIIMKNGDQVPVSARKRDEILMELKRWM